MSVIGRILRRVLLRVLRLGLRRRRLVFLGAVVVSVLIVAGAIGVGPRVGLSLPAPGDARPRAEGEPSSTASYLRGQENYDARMVWDAYSERVTRELQQRGLGLDETQRQLDRARQAGTRIAQINYVGGYPIPNGSMHFYVVFRSDPNRREAVPVPYVFTLDATGKIDSVE